MMHTPKRRPGGRKLTLAVLTLFPLAPAPAAAPAGNQANVELHTDLNTMAVHVGQSAPLPPGGCNPGYTWHTTYGGCRIAQKQSESTQCPSGQAGTRSRDRTAFILQADPANVVYEDWGDWKDECQQRLRATGVVDAVITSVRGKETGAWSNEQGLTGNIARDMEVNYGTRYGVTIYRPTATLNCVYASGTTSGGGASSSTIWYGRLMAPGQSYSNRHNGHCHLSPDGQSAELFGNCNGYRCNFRSRRVRIIATDSCTVTTQTDDGYRYWPPRSYNICQ